MKHGKEVVELRKAVTGIERQLFEKKYWKLPGEAVISYYDLLKDMQSMSIDLLVQSENVTPFDVACKIGCIDSIRLLLIAGYEMQEMQTTWQEQGKKHGHIGLEHSRWKILDLTPIEFAKIKFDPMKIASLIPRSANDIEYKLGMKKLEALVVEEKKKIIEELMDIGFNLGSWFIKACSANQWSFVELMISKGIDIDYIDNKNNSPIHNCHNDILKLLLKNGANKDQTTLSLNTPLYEAALNNDVERVDLLLGVYAKTDIKDESGYTALHVACKHGHEKVAKLLVRGGADIAMANKEGLTPIHYAHRNEMKAFLRLVESKYGAIAAKPTPREGFVEFIKRAETENGDGAGAKLAREYESIDIENKPSSNGEMAALFAVTINGEDYKGVFWHSLGDDLGDATIQFISEQNYKSFTLKANAMVAVYGIDTVRASIETAEFLTKALGIARIEREDNEEGEGGYTNSAPRIIGFAVNGVLGHISDIEHIIELLGGANSSSSDEEGSLLGEFITIEGD